jgi:hypothetical protein
MVAFTVLPENYYRESGAEPEDNEDLLERCGRGKGYLTETQSGSIRPSGLHIKRAGV